MAENEQASSEPKISESTTGIVLVLIFFFPLGFYWIWKQPTWTTNKRSKFAIAGFVWVVMLGVLNPPEQDKPTPETTTPTPRSSTQRWTQPTFSPEGTGDKYDREAARLKARSRSAGNGSLNDDGIQRLMDAAREYDKKQK